MEGKIAGRAVLAMFPGQGSQRPGMAAELAECHPTTAGAVLASADKTLGIPVSELCVSGKPELLRQTEMTQPTILATSLAIFAVLQAHGFEPAAVAGHSLGEYAALTAAGVLTPEAALRLVRRRGVLMAEAAEQTAGAMTAVTGMSAGRVEELCAQVRSATGGLAEVASYNDPQQTVVSGEESAVAELARLATDAGAQQVIRLDVSAPFHCSLMRPVEGKFGAELDREDFMPPRLPMISSVSGMPVSDGQEARWLLRRQLTCPVRWVEAARCAATRGCDALTEVGPGRVLTGFAKRIVPGVPAYSTGNGKSLEALLADLRSSVTPGPREKAIAVHARETR